MSKGGSRPRSGPLPDPKSARSEARGLSTKVLPAAGYSGRVPGLNQFNPRPTARHRARWAELWRTPQATLWAANRYEWTQVARLVDLYWRAEGWDCPAAIFAEILKLETKLALNEEGLRYRGLTIEDVEPATKPARTGPTSPSAPARRLRAV